MFDAVIFTIPATQLLDIEMNGYLLPEVRNANSSTLWVGFRFSR